MNRNVGFKLDCVILLGLILSFRDLERGCPTGSPGAACGPQPTFMWPSKA